MSEDHELLAQLSDVTAKLLRETERLRRDVSGLEKRIPLGPGERKEPENALDRVLPPPRWNISTVIYGIKQSQRSLEWTQREISRICNRIDIIENDSHARDEMKAWLKER